MMHITPSLRRRLLLAGAMPAMICAFATTAHSQDVEIADARTAGITTATANTDGTAANVTTTSASTFTLTGEGPALTLNSDNNLSSGGAITVTDVDNATGILVDTSAAALTGSLSVTGSLTINEEFAPTDDDSDRIIDGAFAQGTGRTGILISGANTFTGPVNVASTSAINIEGNDSAGIRVLAASGVIGDINLLGTVSGVGNNFRGVDLAGPVTGNVTIGSQSQGISSVGRGATALNVSGDVSDRLTVSGTILNTGYRNVLGTPLPTRQNSITRELYDIDPAGNNEDGLEAGNAVNISGNVDGGIYFAAPRTDTTGEDGVVSTTIGATSIAQVGTAAAVLIGSNGTQIIVGRVADITDVTDADYSADLQYSLVNEASISGTNVLDDRGATGMRIVNTTLTDGLNNVNQISSQTYRAPGADAADAGGSDYIAASTALTINGTSVVPNIVNSSIISAVSTEAADLAYADPDNILAANRQLARGIFIGADADVNSLTNTGVIGASLSGREGTAYALVDASGTLAVIDNQGFITAVGATSDPEGNAETNFTLVAVNVSMNTTGITLTQSTVEDANPDDDIAPLAPGISGNVLLGSGADTVDIQSGAVDGDISFGDGADVLNVGEMAIVGGNLSDSDGLLTLNVDGILGITSTAPVNLTEANFSETATFRPTIDGETGLASALMASGTVTFADGASIEPILANVIGAGGEFTIVDAGTLTLEGDISGLQPVLTPYLYNTEISVGATPGQLVANLELKTTDQLGLDTVQTGDNGQTFDNTFAAISASDELGSAFAGIIEKDEFIGAYNQLMPEFGASVARFIHSNTDGATGAVASHLDNARVSDVRPGGVWIEEFAYFADRELAGLSEAYRGHGFGFTGGFDTAFGPFHTAGVNFGFAATEVEDVVGMDAPLAVKTFQTGLYAGYEAGNFGLDVYAGGGYSDIESTRNVEIGSYTGVTQANWGGTHLNASLTAGYDLNFAERYYLRPTVNLSYLALTEDAYTENGDDAIRFAIAEREANIGTATALVNFGAKFGDDRLWWSPALRFGVINEFEGAGILTQATYFDSASSSFADSGTIILAGQEFPDTGAIFGFSLMAGSKYSSFGFDYDADIRDGYNRHIARLVLRLLF